MAHRAPARMTTGRSWLVAAAAALLLAGCTDPSRTPFGPADPESEPPDSEGAAVPGLVVSEPREAPAAAESGGLAASSPVAYVSLAPGTLPDAISIRIRNVTAGDPALPPIPVVDGGFDPVGVPARAEDRLELAVLDHGGAVTLLYIVVPPRRPPVVVRTSPPRGRTDVALSVRPIVVFSEPIDPASLDTASVRLLRGGSPVGGAVTLAQGSPFTAEFTPAGPLEPASEYELVVTSAVLDLDGDALEQEYRASFRTTSSASVGPASIAIVSGNRQRGAPGRELPEPFVVRVTDAYGDGLADVAVTWSADWSFGVLDGLWDLCPEDDEVIHHRVYATVTTDADGFARMSFAPTAFVQTWVRAELAGHEDARVLFTADAADAGASLEIVSGDRQNGSAGPFFEDEPFRVRVTDGQGAPVPNATLSWGVSRGDGVLGDAGCPVHYVDWDPPRLSVPKVVRFVRTGADGQAAVDFRTRMLGISEVRVWAAGIEGGVTLAVDATSLVIGLAEMPSAAGRPAFVDPHFASDAGTAVAGAVEFWNRESAARIVSTSAPPGGAAFDSGPLNRDERFRFVPDVAGTWEFTDEVSGATGTLTARSEDAGHGAIFVSNVTTGGAFDPDGYRVTIRTPGRAPLDAAIELNTGFSAPEIAAGPATVEIDDLAANCTLAGSPSRSVTVARNAQVAVEFAVTCTPPPELAAVRLVFARGSGTSVSHLWAMNADGTGLRQLTSGQVTDVRPIVATGGSRIAFSRDPDGDGPWGHFRVHVIDLDGANLAQLSDYWVPDVAWSWSPDATRIATRTGWNDGRIDVVHVDGTRWSLLNGGGGTGDGRSPAWSPDGSTIAFYRYNHVTDGMEVWAMGADGRGQRFLRRLNASWTHGKLYWTSDGSQILFADSEPGEAAVSTLWRMDADGSNAVRVLEFPGAMSFGALSPDGKLLTMTRQRSGMHWGWAGVDIYLVYLEDGTMVRVTADGLSSDADFLP